MKQKPRTVEWCASATDGIDAAAARHNFRHGLALHQADELAQARGLYRRVLDAQPQHFDATHLLGVIALQLHEPGTAVRLIRRAIDINCSVAAAHNNLGNALCDLGEHAAAIASYDRAIVLAPKDPLAHNNRGKALADGGQFEQALSSYDRSVTLCPTYAEAYNNRGNTLRALIRYAEALANYDKALILKPDYADAYVNRGNALQDLGHHADALTCYDRALALQPDSGAAHRGRGVSLDHLRDHIRAIASYDRAIALQFDDAEAYNARGNAHRALGNAPAALGDYAKAIVLKPARADFHYNRGAVLDDLARHQDALDSYKAALALDPDYPYLPGMRLYVERRICRWTESAGSVRALIERIDRNEAVASPFTTVVMTDSPAIQHKAAISWVRERHPQRFDLPHITPRRSRERLRIGYFSADFHEHATAYLMAELFERHDRSRFELFAFSFGPIVEDAMRSRLRAAFDGFLEVGAMADHDVARLARKLGIDIAVDLKGFTTHNRMDVFSHRAAPVQVNYLGYPGTLGASYIDYLIADPVVIPESDRDHYSEKIVYLPHSYQVNDSQRRISERVFTRRELELPDTGFVYCCFNNNYKLNPEMFDAWVRILREVKDSVLWLFEDNAAAARNLREEALHRDLDPQRLVFAQRMPLPEHLARHRAADLFLDTLPCNAHTTASDALWAGLPVLTRAGHTFAGRVSASLLHALDLPELVTATAAEYEALAIDLGRNPTRLAHLKAKLARNRLTAPLFDSRLFAQHIEAAYTMMFDRCVAGLPPAHLCVTDSSES